MTYKATPPILSLQQRELLSLTTYTFPPTKGVLITELENDPRFNTDDKRLANAEELVAIFDELFATRPRDEWLHIFAEYDPFCCGVNSVMEPQDDPQVTENGYIVDFEHPTLGKIKIPGYPGHFSESWAQTTSAAPDPGEHTEEVLMQVGDYTRKEIAQLREEGVV